MVRECERERERLMERVQGYLAHQKTLPPRTLQKVYACGPMVVLRGGGGGCFKRGTPEECT